MSTQVMDQVTSKGSLSADQQARAAAFAQKELQHASDAPASINWHWGAGPIDYGVGIADFGDGFAEVGWTVSDNRGYCVQQYDWVGVFANANQARVDPHSHYLGGDKGWTFASLGSPFKTDVALQAGMVAAYVIKNAAGDYEAVVISPPFPG